MKLEELKKLCAEVAPAPWYLEHMSRRSYDDNETFTTLILRIEDGEKLFVDKPSPKHERLFEFISHARTMLPKLIAVAEAAKFLLDCSPSETQLEVLAAETVEDALEDLENE